MLAHGLACKRYTARCAPPCLPPQKKGWACTREQLSELRAFKRRLGAYPSCAELLFDDFLRAGLLVGQEA